MSRNSTAEVALGKYLDAPHDPDNGWSASLGKRLKEVGMATEEERDIILHEMYVEAMTKIYRYTREEAETVMEVEGVMLS